MENFIDESPKSVIYALFDNVAHTNVQYFDSCNDETAIRLVKDIAKNPESFLYKHRKDLLLYRLFEYSPKTNEQVFNRVMIYSLSALPEYDESPYGLDKVQVQLTQVLELISDIQRNQALLSKVQQDSARISKQGNVQFLDKLFKNEVKN